MPVGGRFTAGEGSNVQTPILFLTIRNVCVLRTYASPENRYF